eukprot:TRINITY_DN49919_c0_g1_i1.p1 TRINITY_DN49919_c0_g1~~TRINITY_DN49919_c0_g1_i1.p1  ORF type:complete len:369 (-),score=-11.05 TRINITY_DN49919_c0_g1_i1:109-1215(-)
MMRASIAPCVCILQLATASGTFEVAQRQNDTGIAYGPYAVVFRTQGQPQPTFLARMRRWRAQLPLDFDVWISSDQTKKPAAELSNQAVTRMSDHQPVYLHTYSMRDLGSNFPVIFHLDTLCQQTGHTANWCTWARVFQTEAILAWWRAARARSLGAPGDKESPPYEVVWVVQDDVDYTGNIAQFLQSFGTEYDFVSPEPMSPIGPSWPWRDVTTYRTGVQLWFASEGVRGYSGAFLGKLESRTVAGESGWSESAAPTLCRLVGCRASAFPPGSISRRFDWESQGDQVLTDAQLQRLVAQGAAEWQNVWVHKVAENKDNTWTVIIGRRWKRWLTWGFLGAFICYAMLVARCRHVVLRGTLRKLVGMLPR